MALFGRARFGGDRGAGGPEALKLTVGAVEGALDAGFVAGQEGKRVGAAGVAEEDEGHAVVGDEVAVLRVDVSAVIDQAECVGADFHGAGAGKAPGGHDHLMDEEGFDGIERLEMVQVGIEEFVELAFVLARDDSVLGGESMFEGIEADGGLALGGFGAGAALGVPAIGFDLQFGGHNGARFLSDEVAPWWRFRC